MKATIADLNKAIVTLEGKYLSGVVKVGALVHTLADEMGSIGKVATASGRPKSTLASYEATYRLVSRLTACPKVMTYADINKHKSWLEPLSDDKLREAVAMFEANKGKEAKDKFSPKPKDEETAETPPETKEQEPVGVAPTESECTSCDLCEADNERLRDELNKAKEEIAILLAKVASLEKKVVWYASKHPNT